MTLEAWRTAVLPGLRTCSFSPPTVGDVTLLAYFFWDDARLETSFPEIECAFLSAFRCYGLLPSVLVTNRPTPTMTRFAARYGIEIQTEPALSRGGIRAMSRDCLTRLPDRFTTGHVAIIQTDGMLVASGLERFVGRYDYVGAPWASEDRGPFWSHRHRFAVGNGGLSVRSRALCEAAARAFTGVWRHLPYTEILCEDIFCCKTMPFLSPQWRRRFRYPDVATAARFSIECHCPGLARGGTPPAGFHARPGFENYVRLFDLPHADLLERT